MRQYIDADIALIAARSSNRLTLCTLFQPDNANGTRKIYEVGFKTSGVGV